MRGRGRGSKNALNGLNLNMKKVSTETIVICVLLVVLLVLVAYYVRQNREGFESAEQCTVYAFVADWCPHCKNAKPAINNLKNNAPNNVNVEVVNEKDNNSRELMQKYGIKGFPTIILIKADGTVVEFEQRPTEENLNVFVANNAVGNGNVNANANRVNNNANANRVNNNANRVNNNANLVNNNANRVNNNANRVNNNANRVNNNANRVNNNANRVNNNANRVNNNANRVNNNANRVNNNVSTTTVT